MFGWFFLLFTLLRCFLFFFFPYSFFVVKELKEIVLLCVLLKLAG